jgi:diaminopimelate epimerase
MLRGGAISRIRVDMGRASFRSSDLPMRGRARDVVAEALRVGSRRFRVTCVSVGNPHCVRFQTGPLDEGELAKWGPQIERHASFPRRTNVQWARVRSRRSLEAIIWERGAGATLASGSSACAIAAAARRLGLVDGTVRVHMPGGSLAIEIDADWNVRMTGPATPVFRGRIF